jgi:hypothetical protein
LNGDSRQEMNPPHLSTKYLLGPPRPAHEIDGHGMTRVAAGKTANAVVAVETDPARYIRFYLGRLAP